MLKKISKILCIVVSACIIMTLFVIPSYALSDSPIGFNMGVLYGSSIVPTAPTTEIGYSGFQLPGEETQIQWVGNSYYYDSPDNYAIARIRINRQDSSTLVEVGSYDVTFAGVFYRNYDDVYEVSSVQYYITYTDGTTQGYYTSPNTSIQYYETNVTSGTMWRINNVFEFEKPVQFIYIRIFWRLPEPDSNSDNFRMGYGTTSITIDSVTWLDKIINNIKNGIDNIIGLLTGNFTFPSLNELRSTLQDYYFDESNLFNSLNSHLGEFSNTLTNANQRIGNLKGVTAVSNMLSRFIITNSYLSILLWLSLGIGIISFILGTSWLVGKFIDNKPSYP